MKKEFCRKLKTFINQKERENCILMVKNTTKKARTPLKKAVDFTAEDINNICNLGKEKYTVNEISSMLSLNKKGVTEILAEYKISVPKKPNNIQRLYEQGKLNSNQFFIEASSLIKSRLMPDLIYKGYFRDGKRQISFNQEDVEDCYAYILRKIIDKYDPSKGTLATFIRTWVRGYGTTVTTAQHRRYNKVGNDSSLDENYNNSIKEEFKDSFNFEDLENALDKFYFKDELRFDKSDLSDMVHLKDLLFSTLLKDLYNE